MRPTRLVAVTALLALAACATPRARLWDGMGDHHLTVDPATPATEVSSADALARRYFDQGVALSYGFNHDEAVCSFREASRLDPGFAMAYWGEAYALSPNINLPMDEDHGRQAYAAIQKARANAAGATELERDLIEALARRFEDPPPADRVRLDRAYADAMRALWHKYPRNDDVGFLFADALMNLHPWDLWTPDFEPKEDTPELVATLEAVLALNPEHPGANHFYIHTMEASGNPARAEPSADRLGRLVPGIGHMVHMPSHIYVQVGRFTDSMRVNEKASDLDRGYFATVGDQGVYHFYHAHNNHFRVWSAMYQGRYEDALYSCKRTLDELPAHFHADPGAAEWLVMDVHVNLRFGKWEAALALPMPRQDQPYAVAMWHYGRGLAYANTGRIAEARAEAEAFEREFAKVPEDQTVFIVPARDVLKVAREMLAGETEYHAGNHEEAFARLRKAVEAEDALRYSEPSPWMMPTRHALGALLLEQGHVDEAEACYRHDLRQHPGNGWSLHGLADCLEKRGVTAEAADVRKQFDKAWANATVEIKASCYCADHM
ncbi:MAG: tetratricopeptide repeat protein [Planctomycetota bacterium]